MPDPQPEPDATEAEDTPPPEPAELGRTAPNKDGRTYPHGTVTAYNLGGCRCQHCRDACARYRAPVERTAKTTRVTVASDERSTPTDTSPAAGSPNTSGHPPSPPPASTSRPRPRPTPRPRLLAARRRRRHPNRQRTPRPRQPAHHREIPAHPARHRRNRPRRAPPHQGADDPVGAKGSVARRPRPEGPNAREAIQRPADAPTPTHDGISEVAGKIAAMDRFVMRSPVADDHQVMQPAVDLIATHSQVSGTMRERRVRTGDPQRGQIPRGHQIAPEPE